MKRETFAGASVHRLPFPPREAAAQRCPVREANHRALLRARLRARYGEAGVIVRHSSHRLRGGFARGLLTGAAVVGAVWGLLAWIT